MSTLVTEEPVPVVQSDVADTPPAPRRDIAAIDILKGLAILSVLWQHTVPPTITRNVMGSLWIRPAVPIFFLLMGLNLATSLRRTSADGLTGQMWKRYLLRRVDRIAVPFLLILATGYVIAAVRGNVHLSPGLLVGGFPVNAPGSYFITALISLTLVFPFIVAAYRRAPRATLVALVAINVVFEAIAYVCRHHGISLLSSKTIVYQGSPFRYTAVVAIGLWMAHGSRRVPWRGAGWIALVVLSGAYLVGVTLHPSSFHQLPGGFIRETSLMAAPWAFLLVALGLRYLPDVARAAPSRGLVTLGRLSYHIFLVQILVCGVLAHALRPAGLSMWGRAAFAPLIAAIAIALGILYARVVPSGTGLLAWRPARRARTGGVAGVGR